MDDKKLIALVNHFALEAGGGLTVGTLYGDLALAVGRAVREQCIEACKRVAAGADAAGRPGRQVAMQCVHEILAGPNVRAKRATTA